MYFTYFCQDNETNENFTFNSAAELPLGVKLAGEEGRECIIKDVAVFNTTDDLRLDYELMRGMSM